MTDPSTPPADPQITIGRIFLPGSAVRITATGEEAIVIDVRDGKAHCKLGRDGNGWRLSRWIPVGNLEHRA